MNDVIFTYDDSMIFLFGFCCFFVGIAIMFAIHRVIFDYYDEDAKQEIYNLKCQVKTLEGDNYELQQRIIQLNTQLSHKEQDPSIVVEHMIHHTFATPADVADLDFLEG